MQDPFVVIQRATYAYPSLRKAIWGLFDRFLGQRVSHGMRVLIKPNLLAPAPPEKAMVTHPLVVKAVAEYVLARGAHVTISDSQGMGRFDKILSESGLADALQGLDVRCREFRESREIVTAEPFRKLEIAADALDADLVINLPKLKTHAQMRMTLGVKNLFGCVVGLRKPEWHFRAGVNRELFASLLVRIHHTIAPSLTLIDGILGMEGDGPGRSGTPRELGFLAVSDNTYALDSEVCRLLGMDPHSVFTNRAAKDFGYLPKSPVVECDVPPIENFRVPELTPLVFGPPRFHGVMRRHFVQRPITRDSECVRCGECVRYCPAGAIAFGGRSVVFDYTRCIRCYCCLEVCPKGALHTYEPLAGKLLRKLGHLS